MGRLVRPSTRRSNGSNAHAWRSPRSRRRTWPGRETGMPWWHAFSARPPPRPSSGRRARPGSSGPAAVRSARRSDSAVALADALYGLTSAVSVTGTIAAARPIVNEFLSVAASIGDWWRVSHQAASRSSWRGPIQAARPRCSSLPTKPRPCGGSEWQAYVTLTRGWVAGLQGRLADAAARLTDAAARYRGARRLAIELIRAARSLTPSGERAIRSGGGTALSRDARPGSALATGARSPTSSRRSPTSRSPRVSSLEPPGCWVPRSGSAKPRGGAVPHERGELGHALTCCAQRSEPRS